MTPGTFPRAVARLHVVLCAFASLPATELENHAKAPRRKEEITEGFGEPTNS